MIYRRQNYRFEMMPHCRFEMTDCPSLWNDDDALFEMTMTVTSKWRIACRFEMMMTFSSGWRIDYHFNMMMTLSSRGIDWMPSAYFRNDSHISCHRRMMLCPVVFTSKRIVYFEERPYIFGNDSLFQRDN